MLTRRNAIVGAAAAFGGASSALAAMNCSPYSPGVNLCTVGVPSLSVDSARSQDCSEWCWAACIASIFRLNGYEVSQRRIAAKVFGSDICRSAAGPQVIYAINGDWESEDGERFRAYGEPLADFQFGVFRPDAVLQAANSLRSGQPLINGAVRHATVLTAMSYLIDAMGRSQIVKLTVRDPWNPSGRSAIRRDLSVNEAYGTNFLARVVVQG